ncbi:MAG: acyl-CoA dehydrogenase family protein [Dehalococcoidia bacterium]|nr:acyl-CoA dehydrogenase family protein [Dehalococcoidia bacterium]
MQRPDEREEVAQVRAAARALARRYGRAYWLEKAQHGEAPEELWQDLAQGGYLGLTIPEEYGGAGCHLELLAALIEELSADGLPLFMLVLSTAMAHLVLARHGTPQQKATHFPALLRGESRFCFAITEPDAGSNSFNIRTLARREGDSFVISGQKVFISGVDHADHMLVVARTSPREEVADKRQGMGMFIVGTKAEGLQAVAMDTRILITERQFQVFLDRVTVPASALVGEESKGLDVLFDALNPERITVAAMAVGLGRYALAKAVDYARRRVVFNVPIGAHQGLAHPLAMVATELELAGLMARHAARLFDAGVDRRTVGIYANMAKYAAAEAAIRAVDTAIQVHGGAGFTGEADVITIWPLVRLFRTAPVSREMILNYIAEHHLGLPRSY